MITRHKAGGFVFDDARDVVSGALALSAPDHFTVPVYQDFRPYCLPTSNQGDSSACAGFATAGICEVRAWHKSHVATQVDGYAIYSRAKEIDGNQDDGTSGTSALMAAMSIGVLDDAPLRFVANMSDLQFALHRSGPFLGAFRITSGWNFASKKTGRIAGFKRQLGGHAVLIVGYDDYGPRFQNSWAGWGENGFGQMSWKQFKSQFMYGVTTG